MQKLTTLLTLICVIPTHAMNPFAPPSAAGPYVVTAPPPAYYPELVAQATHETDENNSQGGCWYWCCEESSRPQGQARASWDGRGRCRETTECIVCNILTCCCISFCVPNSCRDIAEGDRWDASCL